MKTGNIFLKTLVLLVSLTTSIVVKAQCSVSIAPASVTINCGQSVQLEALGLSSVPALSTDFNNFSLGTGWSTTAVLQYTNPCSPSLDGTPTAWYGNVPLPRRLETNAFDVSCGGEICFDLDYGADDNATNSCEDPDLVNEGVYLQYSVDNGLSWQDIYYFQPTSNKSGPFYSWANYCFTIPPAAWSSQTRFRWNQPVATSTIHDHWGIDNVIITPAACGGTYDWSHIPGTVDPASITVSPTTTTDYTVTYSDSLGNMCTDVVTVTVIGLEDAGDDGSIDICETNGTLNLFPILNGTPDTGGTWIDVTGSGGLSGAFFNPLVSGPGVFEFIYEVSGSCNTDSSTVTVSVTAAADAGLDGSMIICSGETFTEAQLFAELGGNPDPGGVWSGPASGAGVYTYTVNGTSPCPTVVSSTVTVSESQVQIELSSTGILCNGGTADITVTGLEGIAPYSGTGTFTEPAGTYTYTVTDNNGCSATEAITITEPSPLVASVTSTAFDCNGGPTQIVVSATGGTAPYVGTGTFDEAPGTYTYEIIDDNGCSVTETITVTGTIVLATSATSTPIDCNGGTSDITVSATGGMAPYTGTGTFTETAGTYTYFVSDENGCQGEVTITVTEPSPLVASATATTIACNGGTADITVSATGGTPMYTGGYTGEGTFTVTAGTYTYTVTDMNGCTSDVTITVTEPSALVASATATSIACNGGTADITVSATGGMPMYTGGYTGEGIFTVTAGTYTYTVTDMNGCTSDVTITVTEPTPLVASATATSIACNGGTADITVSATGGMPMYTGGYTGEGTFTVTAGTYTYTVTDMNGCTSDVTITVTEPSALVASSSATSIDCNGGSSTVTVMATGGTAPYTGTGTFSETAGTYTYTVTDANGCTSTTTVTITEPTQLAITVTSAGIACNGGTVDVTVSATGGTAPYTGTGIFSEGSGTYTYTVTDANGCSASGEITIYVEDLNVQINGAPVLCFGDTVELCGEIITNELFFSEYVEGSSFNKCIEIYNGTGSDIDLAAEGYALDLSFNGGSGTGSIALTGTIANGGTYVLCDDGAAAAFLASADQTTTSSLWNGDDALILSKSGVAVDIFGVVGDDPGSEWTSGSNSTANSTLRRNGNVNVGITSNPSGSGAGAFSSLESQWTSTSNNDASGLGSHSLNTNGTIAWSTGDTTNCLFVSPTSNEVYSFTYTSSNGCTSSASYTVTVSTQLVASSSATSIDCNGGSSTVTVTATGGTAPYSGTGTFSETAGTYTYTVTDANGCTSSTTVTITEPTQLAITVTSAGIACNGGTVDVTVSATGGTAPYTGTGIFSEGSGTYTYTVTDANGCSDSGEITIYVEDLNVQINGAPVLCFGDTVELCGEIITNELFFSEYVEGSSFNKCIEIYNGTGSDIDLAAEGYALDLSFNGGSGTGSIALTGTIANGGTYVLCDDGAAAAFLASADQTTTSSLWNGDDALILSKSGVAVDIFGVVGDDPGSEWTSGSNSTANSTLRRNGNVNVGITSNPSGSGAGAFSSLESQWTSTSNNDASGLGSHSLNTNGTIAWSTGDTTNCLFVSPTSNEVYSFTYTSSNGCTSSASYTVTVPTQLVASSSATSIDCNGGSSDVTVTATGGTAPYTGTGTFSETAGTYTYTVTDANGCTSSTTVTIAEPTTVVASSSATSIDCNGGSSTVTVTATGGTAPYTGTGTFSETAGTYTYTVTDANGCTSSTTVTITEPTQLVASSSATSIDCNGGSSDVTVTATGGTAPYSGTGTFSETTGTYTYTVTDANGCTSSTTVTIAEPTTVVASSSATSIDCNGGSSTVTVTATGGTAPYTGVGTFSETAGTYTYTVTDANGCTSSTTVTITEPTQLVASSSATSIDCSGGSSIVTVTATGGTAPYTGTGTFSETAGTYTYTVTDANGCTSSTTVTITEPTQLVASSTSTSIDCSGGSADVTVTATGGTAPYTGVGTFSETAGTYTYTVTDANGCTSSTTVTISEPTQLVASSSATSIDCNGGSSTVTVTATGGTAPYTGTGTFTVGPGTYTYTVTDANGCSAIETITVVEPAVLVASSTTTGILCNGGSADVVVTATGGTAPYTGIGTFSETAGTYTYTVTDANGCTSSTTITLTEPSLMTAYASCPVILCNGGTADIAVFAFGGTAPYTGIGVFNVGAGTYTYTVTDANGCTATVTHTVTEPAAIDVTVSSTGIDCNGGTADVTVTATGGTGTLTGTGTFTVGPGTYTYTVTDANGCTGTETITVVEPAVLVASSSAASILCNGGSADVVVTATGGTAPYTGTGTFSETAGTYTYTVTDANGCTASTTVTLTEPSLMTAYASCPVILCNGGTADIAIFAFGGTAPYTGVGVFNVGAGTYTYTVTDANGCTATVTHTVTEPAAIDVTVSSTGIDCNGGTADVTVTATGGTAPYTGTGTFSQAAGTVTYTVTDANGCTGTETITVAEPTVLVASSSAASILCNGGAADVTVTATGGTAPYTGTGTFSETAGTYTYTVTDANGCTASTTVTLTEPSAMTAYVSCPGILCNGGTADVGVTAFGGTAPYTGTGVFTVGAGTYTYTVTDANGCTASVTHTVTEPAAIVATATVGALDCANETGEVTITATGGTAPYIGTGMFTQANGTTTYTVTDANGCTTTVDATVEVENFVDLACPGDQTFDCNYSQNCGSQNTGSVIFWDEPTASSFSTCDNGCGPNTQIAGFIYMGEYNGSRYYCSNSSNYSWQAANTAATTAGGHLASIQSAGENQFIKNAIGAQYAWIGLTDENVEGTFEWTSGENVGYTNWAGNEPNNNGPTGNTCGYCGEADYAVIKKNSGVWYDRFECNLNEFVMEIPCGNPITITQTAGPANGSFADGGTTQTVTYVATDNVTGATATCSFNVTVEDCAPVYCESEASCSNYEWIKKVKLGSINNWTGNDGGYGDYTSLTTTHSAGDNVNLVLKPGFSGSSYTEAWRVFIDWNYDGDFYDQGEMVYQGSGNSTMYGSFTVPQFAATDKDLRVRVSMQWNCYAGPCSNFNYGEVEDYTIRVESGSKSFLVADDNVNMYDDVKSGAAELELGDIYPNPVLSSNGIVNLDVRTGIDAEATVRIYDLSGKVVLTEAMRLETGANRSQIDVTGFARGSYVIEVVSGDTKETTPLIVQ